VHNKEDAPEKGNKVELDRKMTADTSPNKEVIGKEAGTRMVIQMQEEMFEKMQQIKW
jgi:hypothetical protein